MSNTSRKSRGLLTFVISGVIILAAVWILLNRQYALDVVTNWTYKPTQPVESIVGRTELTDKGKFMFYATRPEVLNSEQFNSSCPRQEAGSPILGCYTAADRIYMYNVTDKQLDGMKEVTAAHELLHAVWQRTSESDKKHIGGLLETAYKSMNNQALKTRMEYYERTEPGEFINELHSILGTETANLGSELEAYYTQFFNRSKVIALHDNYSTLYLSLSARADELFAQMTKMSSSIDAMSKTYNASLTEYSSAIESFNQRATSGGFSSNAQFNTERAALVARSAQLEADRLAINAQIATYNSYHEEYKKIGEQIKTLNEGMDSYHTIEEAPVMER